MRSHSSGKTLKTYKLPSVIECIVFDIDSTLYTNDTYVKEQHRALISSLASFLGISDAAAKKSYLDVQEESLKASGVKLSMGNAFHKLGYSLEMNMDARVQTFCPEKHLSEDPKLRVAIADMSERYRIAALTNNPKEIGRRTLSVLGVDDMFELVLGADTFMQSKPSRAPYDYISGYFDIDFKHMVSVGDRYDVDILFPVSLGCGGVLVEHVSEVYHLPEML